MPDPTMTDETISERAAAYTPPGMPVEAAPKTDAGRIADALERIAEVLDSVHYRGSIVTSVAEDERVGWRAGA